MAFNRILIANRGEIAIRLARAIADCDATSVAVYAEDDAQSLHVRSADQAVALQGQGVAAYLDAAIDLETRFPGFGNDIHGLRNDLIDGERRWRVDCLVE